MKIDFISKEDKIYLLSKISGLKNSPNKINPDKLERVEKSLEKWEMNIENAQEINDTLRYLLIQVGKEVWDKKLDEMVSKIDKISNVRLQRESKSESRI